MQSHSFRRKAGLIIGCATLASLIYATQFYLYHRLQSPEPYTVGTALAEGFVDWYVWAALAPVILSVARRIPFRRNRWPFFLLVHVPASLIFSFIHIIAQAALDQTLIHGRYDAVHVFEQSRNLFARTFHFGVLIYCLIVIIRNAFDYFRDQEIHAARLQAELARAQLQTLQMQIHPHFLFNTLHAISSLMPRDLKAADRMIASLSDLLRMSIAQTDLQEVSLRQELEFLDKYLEIEKMRFQNRLQVEMKIDSDILECQVPRWILQPLAENSIRHGLSKHDEKGKIEIEAHSKNGFLEIHVRDNGRGIDQPAERVEGIGLRNIRARLRQLYRADQEMEIKRAVDGGTDVMIRLPLHSKPLLS